ncbi:MAG: hypothetical protein IJG38_01455 [Thermoguttaceae bacterium]|nr:hypothetical protein [Thermoguttaceae bacterium]
MRSRTDKVLLPKKPVSALPMSNQEPTLSARTGNVASPLGRFSTEP